MKAITENEFKDALKIVDAYFDQVNENIKKVKSKGMINHDLMISKETRLTDLPFNISYRLLNALKINHGDDDNQDLTVGWLEGINIKTFCDEFRIKSKQ